MTFPLIFELKIKLYGKNGDLHTNFDHEKLRDVLLKTEHTFLMTIDDSEHIRNLYENHPKFYIQDWDLQYGMNNTGKNKDGSKKKASKGKELFISNYELPSTKKPESQS